MSFNQKRNAQSTRRAFLGGGSVAALGAAISLPALMADEPNGEHVPRPGFPLVNVHDTGAIGDGQTDDTEALKAAVQRAKGQSTGVVYLPAGIYLLSDALRLPSNVRLVGAGKGLTTLLAAPETLFPLFRPDPRTQEIRQRRSMLTTESVGSVRESITENIAVAHLTIDWNHCPTEGFGSSCVLIDSADHSRLEQVRFARCLPADHPRRLEEMKGSGFRSECVMFSNARHGILDGCELVDSGYRPLSVAYGSLDITFQNGRIVATNPVWRHAFAEVHGDGIPRDEHYVRSQLKCVNSTFILAGGTAQDGLCSHTGTLFVENCDFFIEGGTRHFTYVIKPFDASWNCQCLNNRFNCEGDFERRFSIIGSIGNKRNEDMLFVGNIVDVTYTQGSGDETSERGLVDFSRNELRCRVQDNQFLLRYDEPGYPPAIRLENTRCFTVAGNLIEFRGAFSEEGPIGIVVKNGESGTIMGNVISGDCGIGLRLAGQLDGVLATGNSVPSIAAEELSEDNRAKTHIQGNLVARA